MIPESTAANETTQGDVVISVSDVSKTYRLYSSHQDRLKEALHPFRKRYHKEFSALDGVTFEIRRGESVGIIGRNGAGKSTLLQLIAGVLSPTAGTISVAGTVAALLELGAGFNPDLTGRENVILASTIQGIAESEIAEHVAAVEAFADVGIFFDQPMKVYSSGMFARVAFANAINVNPDILIVDEILGVGDARFQEKCYNKISELRDNGVCILFVSHSTEVIQRNCELALLLEGGRVVSCGPTDTVVAAYQDMLRGSLKKPDQLTISAPNRAHANMGDIEPNAELGMFLEWTGTPFYKSFPCYNPNERRIGSGDADIVDFFITADDNQHFNVLTGSEQLTIHLKVNFNRTVKAPSIGWAITSSEGIVIAGSNTAMKKIQLLTANVGETWIYTVTISLSLCGGQYFVNFGIGGLDQDGWAFLDERRAVVHLSVADSRMASGFFQIPSSFDVARSPRITID